MFASLFHARPVETMAPTRQSLIDDEDFRLDGSAVAREEGAVTDEIWFDAILYPHRSLSPSAFRVLMLVVVAVNIVSAVYYLILGAWPIMIFAFLDVVIVWWAFQVNYRQGRLRERLLLVGDQLEIYRVQPTSMQSCWRLPAGWVRLSYDKPMRHEGQISLHYKGGILLIGSFLSPRERTDLAMALEHALARCRQAAAHQGHNEIK